MVVITGSSAIPQMGQVPGLSWRISGCMGQVYTVPATGAPSWVSWAGATYCAGSARNFSRQWGLQKAYVTPL